MKFTFNHTQEYRENPQKNPIRWRFMLKTSGPGEAPSFDDQANWMKCKDFFNDVVAAVTGKYFFSVYSFENKNIKTNEEGFYVLVNNIVDKDSFYHNLALVNSKLEEDLECVLEWDDVPNTQQVLLLFPKEVLLSTYYVSLLTLLIRWSNYEKKANSWEDLWEIGNFYEPPGNFTATNAKAVAFCKKHGFKNEKAKEYWWYSSPKVHSKIPENLCVNIAHNNGICAWTAYEGVV